MENGIQVSNLKPLLLDESQVMEAFGKLRGLGQWRNSGKGRFTYEILG